MYQDIQIQNLITAETSRSFEKEGLAFLKTQNEYNGTDEEQ